MYDVCAIGDALIDFIPAPDYLPEKPLYLCNVGGTVANLAVATSKLDLKTLIVSKVGDDTMGKLIKDTMDKNRVDSSEIIIDDDAFTTLSFVSLAADGERSFSFSRKHAADIRLDKSELDIDKMLNTKVLHFSGMCMTDDPIKEATFYTLKMAKERDIIITLDVNYRERLWKSEEDYKEVMMSTLPYVTIFKAADDEVLLLTGENSVEEAAKKISLEGPELVIISLGAKGSYYYYKGMQGRVSSYATNPVDTTGAGDCFFAAFIYKIVANGGIADLNEDKLTEMLDFANASGAICVTKRGGVTGSSSYDEIDACRSTMLKLEL